MNPTKIPDTESNNKELFKLYWQDNLTLNEIAQRFGYKGAQAGCRIAIMFDKRNLPRRTRSQASSHWHKLHPEWALGFPNRDKSRRWRGGRHIRQDGYVTVIHPDSPHRCVYVLEHRLIAEQKIGRPLKRTEIVHHLNGIRNDNRPENLAVILALKHRNKGKTFVLALQKRIRELEQLHLL